MKIAPCPFCDSPSVDVVEVDVGRWAVVCHRCEAIGPGAFSAEDAIKAWGRGRERRADPLDNLDG